MATMTRAGRAGARRRGRRRTGRSPLARAEPAGAARAAALQYVSDRRPGIRRRRNGHGFSYVHPDGRTVRDRATLARIRALAVPPAWIDVWICPVPNGHLQATGRDASGRKQYRYHARWRAVRDETKFDRMALFGRALPRIRARVADDLAAPGLPREKVLATIVRLLETTYARVGNEEYARQNGSFGLTTLRNRHVEIRGSRLRFRFRGKAKAFHAIEVSDRRLADLVRRCRDLPGQELFQYVDESGEPRPIDSADVNTYLREISGEDFTAKDFRTWAGSLLAACEIARLPPARGNRAAHRRALVRVVDAVARQLRNTPAVCRKSYIHPLILAAHAGALRARWRARPSGTAASLGHEERALLAFLESAAETSATPSAA